MLARTQEALHQTRDSEAPQKVTALRRLLSGLFDYAGLFPPASLPLPTAIEDYRHYLVGPRADALGCFVIGLAHVPTLSAISPADLGMIPLSASGAFSDPWAKISDLLNAGFCVRMVEVKIDEVSQVHALGKIMPPNVTMYFEIPFHRVMEDFLSAIASVGGRVKLRMGGVSPEAFPDVDTVAATLQCLAAHHLRFKATAGLHHPIRSSHPVTSAPDAPAVWMHGFLNFCCAAALLHQGGSLHNAAALLAEQDPSAWTVAQDFVQWRSHRWSIRHLAELRDNFLMSIGSCSFTEPFEDLEALGWL